MPQPLQATRWASWPLADMFQRAGQSSVRRLSMPQPLQAARWASWPLETHVNSHGWRPAIPALGSPASGGSACRSPCRQHAGRHGPWRHMSTAMCGVQRFQRSAVQRQAAQHAAAPAGSTLGVMALGDICQWPCVADLSHSSAGAVQCQAAQHAAAPAGSTLGVMALGDMHLACCTEHWPDERLLSHPEVFHQVGGTKALRMRQRMHAPQLPHASPQGDGSESAAGTLPCLGRQCKGRLCREGYAPFPAHVRKCRHASHHMNRAAASQEGRRNALQVQVREGRGAEPEDLQARAGPQRQVCHGCHMQLHRLQAVAVLHLQQAQSSHERQQASTLRSHSGLGLSQAGDGAQHWGGRTQTPHLGASPACWLITLAAPRQASLWHTVSTDCAEL